MFYVDLLFQDRNRFFPFLLFLNYSIRVNFWNLLDDLRRYRISNGFIIRERERESGNKRYRVFEF